MVTDTLLSGFYFSLVRETLRLTDEGRRRFFLTSPRLNSKSGCDSEGIHSLHPLSDWSSDYYVRWRQLKVTKLGFISRRVMSARTCQTAFENVGCLNLRVLRSFPGCFQTLKVITERLARLCRPVGCMFNNLFRDGADGCREVSRSKCIPGYCINFNRKRARITQYIPISLLSMCNNLS